MTENIPDPNSQKRVYVSMKALSAAKNIPYNILKVAKSMDAPGFNTNNSINWIQFQPWYEQNKDILAENETDSLGHYKKEIAKRDVVIRDEQIKRLKGESLDPADVKSFLNKLSSKQKAVLTKRLSQDLASKHPELKPEIDQAIHDVCSIFQTEQSKWIR